jgi:DNA mismatch repair protein MutS
MAKSSSDTPLMQQHKAIKQRYPDAILLFRVGDFYETFGADAITASQVLGITLTKRNSSSATSLELAGFPHHALDTYLHKLVKAGHRVAICDQLEDPKQAKGIVKRGVTELVTPGIATNDKLLEHNSNNFLAAIHFNNSNSGIAFLDISTGEFFVAEGDIEYLDKLLQSLKPAEVIFQKSYQKLFKETFGLKFFTYTLDCWIFEETFAREQLLKNFETHSLKGFGIDNLPNAIIAAGVILHYLKDTEHPNLQHLTSIQRIEKDQHLWMDKFTIRNLELIHSSVENGNSLLKTIDSTVSAMGARLLRRWILMPLKDIQKINERLNTVEYLIKEPELRNQIIVQIKQCGDIERLVSKIPTNKINPREIIHLSKGLQSIEHIKKICSQSNSEYLQRLADALNACKFISDKIINTIISDPPISIYKGSVIKEGIHKELDNLKKIAEGGKEYLINIQQREAELTGISSLKISFNNVFGYYLEVTNIHKNKVPSSWIRKQTLTNAERYITPELKEYEEKITGAEDKINSIENEIFEQLQNELLDYILPFQTNSQILANLDCLICFAENAIRFNYKKPELKDDAILNIIESRHPVIEQNLLPGEQYITNNVLLNKDEQQIIILTGPNMSGKSALLRQTALIILMAHMGSFVPAQEANIPLTDKIFTRVGASDNLSGGESTFMVEMNEAASILNNISERSLVILDEIGRGTSTYDGISIAWSMIEYLHNAKAKPKTLFATHYHEINELENKLSSVKNFHISHKEIGNKIIFLRKLLAGGSTHSFGIHVAKMAGMPNSIIQRANEVLKKLEEKNETSNITLSLKEVSKPELQLSIFDTQSQIFQEIRTALEDIDINRLTPVEALMKLNEIKNKLK